MRGVALVGWQINMYWAPADFTIDGDAVLGKEGPRYRESMSSLILIPEVMACAQLCTPRAAVPPISSASLKDPEERYVTIAREIQHTLFVSWLTISLATHQEDIDLDCSVGFSLFIPPGLVLCVARC